MIFVIGLWTFLRALFLEPAAVVCGRVGSPPEGTARISATVGESKEGFARTIPGWGFAGACPEGTLADGCRRSRAIRRASSDPS